MKEMEFELDKSSKVKLYHQLYQIFVSMITKGELAQGSRLPSIRNLSEDYGISRNTVTKAYSELEKDGYIYSLSKSGFFVKNPDEIIPSEQSVPKTEQEDDDIPTVDSLLRNSTSDTDFIISKDTEGDLLHSNLDADSVIQKTDTIILKDSFSLDQIVPPDSSAIPLDNSGNKEHTILMNSGDIVESDSNNEVILSPNEAFIDSCITALAEHHKRIEGNKKSDFLGEAPLRIAIAAFIYKFHRIDINPAQIALGSNLSYLLLHFLQLDEFQNPSKYVHGLLRLAENSISTRQVEPVVAFTSDIDTSFKAPFIIAGLKTVTIDMQTTEEQIKRLEEEQVTIFVTSTRTIGSKNLSPQDQKHVFEWLNARDYRYIFEYDNSTEPHQYTDVYNDITKSKCIYINSFANLISKSINTSFIAAPKKIIDSYTKKYQDFGSPLSMIDQCGLIDFLIKGKLYNYLTNLERL